MGQNHARNQVFCHFLKLGSLVVLEIAHNDSLQQFLSSSTGKIHEKKFGAQIWAKGTKIRPEIRFFAISSSLVHQFSFKLHRMIAWNNLQLLVEVKSASTKKIEGPKFGSNGPISVPKLGFLLFSQVQFISFPLNCIG